MKHKSIDQIAVIVPNWNGASSISDCLDSLSAQSTPATIIVVDNGSVDNSIHIIESKFPNVILLKQPKNLGFAGGVNRGIEYCIGNNFKFIALFNNDAVADKGWVKELRKTMDIDKKIGIVTCLFLHSNGKTIDSTGEQYSKWGLPFPRNRGESTVFAHNDGYIFGASGGATLYRTSLFQDIGLFDESFFAYYEDTDISFRAQLSGWKIAYNSEAIAYHEQGATSKKIPGFTVHQTFKNLPLLFLKNVPSELLLPIGLRFCLAYTLMYLNTFTHRTGWAATKGIFKAFVLSFRALKHRRAIQRNKNVTTAYIKSILWDDLPPDQTGLRKMRNLFTGK